MSENMLEIHPQDYTGPVADFHAKLMGKHGVDYDRKIEEAVVDGKYGWRNSDITTFNFPTTLTGRVEIPFHLVHFNRYILSDDVIDELDKKGLRPANIHELLVVGAVYPELQRDFPIIALGSVWRGNDGYRCVPYLHLRESERCLDLQLFGGWIDVLCRFVAVPQ